MEINKGEHHEVVPWFARGAVGTNDHATMVVAEIGNTHEGSLGNLLKMIESSACCGVDAVKLQYHIASFESSNKEQWPKRFKFHPQDIDRSTYWDRMTIHSNWWNYIQKCCNDYRIGLIVSPFSCEAVERLERNVDLWGYKIASGETNNRKLISRIGQTHKRVILSTGMSDTREVNANVENLLKQHSVEHLYVLQCTTEYPTPLARIGMNVVEAYSRNFLFKGGLSDHSGSIFPSIIAAYLGAWMVEVHVCFSREQFGADITSSITFDELECLVEGVRDAVEMRRFPINKDMYQPSEDSKVYREGKQR